MNKEQLEQVLDMCQTPGWKALVEDVHTRLETLKNGTLFNAESYEDVIKYRSEYYVLSQLINTEETVKDALKQLEMESDD